ncbi:MAG: argininosuccinate synthase [Thermoprotei archaeon]|nr:MAG: argininosuccinate synthase [Thermoprotei archaeon]
MRVVLAYSGGLDTSVILALLKERLKAEVITVTVDVGQKEDFDAIAAKAEKLGAVKHYIFNAKEEFARNYVFKAVKANALYEGKYPLSSALSRPLIAEKLVYVARKEGADAVAHGCTGKGNDQVRFDITIKALNPDLEVIAPIRDWGLLRDWELEYAKSRGIPLPSERKIYSIDENLWGRSIEAGPIEDPFLEPPEDAFAWTVPPTKAPDKPEYVTIEFKDGVPVALNGEVKDPVNLVMELNSIAGRNGVGRVDHIEDRTVGLKSREVYEVPAALTVIEAHKDLEKLVLTRKELTVKELMDTIWTDLVYTGLWVEPLRKEVEAFIDAVEARVSGEVKVKLYKGSIAVVGRRSPNSLYDIKLATYTSKSAFKQELAKGFIEFWGMQCIAVNRLLGKV